ncbi:flagellar protein FlgN [Microbacterium protaetiae]|uniref:Flagellar protein FlgN n=1 Tax=Microbacterium protaetiae TaxID=2509458 RepID=A0A4P6ECX0_9MICO|nr:flagellar export chaperone FlgN [Microbacterium protaetiae]QAY60085.1 flagellar protein FlgN [Microbacterium protaetiae]
MGTNELSMRLWHERELLEMLLFKLEVQHLLLAAGSGRWMHFATHEIEQVLDRLRTTGIARVVDAAAVAEEWGAPEDATLRALIEYAPSTAWRDVFTDHLRVLTQLVAEIGQLRDSNVQQLGAVMRATQETIAGLGADTGEYTTGGVRARTDAARIIETEM